jgi:hypothetical protein
VDEYDQRQYYLMRQFIKDFETGNLNLRVLIDSLRGLMNCLQTPDNQWKTLFKQEWWTLEEIYSIALDKGQSYLATEVENNIYAAIENMKELLDRVIIINPADRP